MNHELVFYKNVWACGMYVSVCLRGRERVCAIKLLYPLRFYLPECDLDLVMGISWDFVLMTQILAKLQRYHQLGLFQKSVLV